MAMRRSHLARAVRLMIIRGSRLTSRGIISILICQRFSLGICMSLSSLSISQGIIKNKNKYSNLGLNNEDKRSI